MEFTVTELPSELHITIATYLDVADLHAFATTNSTYMNLFSPTVVREILQGIAITELMPYPQLFRQFYQPHYFLDNYEAFTHQVVQWLLGKSKSIAASLIYLLSYSVLENPKYQSTLYDFLISEAVQRSGCSAAILDNDAFFEYHIISKSTGYQYIATNLIITNPLPHLYKAKNQDNRTFIYDYMVEKVGSSCYAFTHSSTNIKKFELLNKGFFDQQTLVDE
jgi:hypothetical protein